MKIGTSDYKTFEAVTDACSRSASTILGSSVLFLLVFVFAATANATPTLLNGSFESGPAISGGLSYTTLSGGSTAITGWTVTGSTIDYIGPTWDVFDGVRAIDLDGAFSTGGIEQTFTTSPGLEYFVWFYLSGNSDGLPQVKNVRVSVDGFTQDYSFDTSGQTRSALIWEPINFSFVASGTNATLSFTSLSPSGNSWGALIDDVGVSPVPEPASLLLLGTGLVLLGMMGVARRRARHG